MNPSIIIDTELLWKKAPENDAVAFYDEDTQIIILGWPTTRELRIGTPLSQILHHEELHHVLNTLEGKETSLLYDNLNYRQLEGSP